MTLAMLDLKLIRDLWRIKGQALAIILVHACGISLLVMSLGMIASLSETMDAYYDRYRFTNVFASATRVPVSVLSRIEGLDGVAGVDGRINGTGLVDLPDIDAPVTARFVSLDPGAELRLNDIHLVRGRMPEPLDPDEILLLEAFANAHGLGPGDRLAVTVYGTKRTFTIAGVALSPEFIYAVAPGAITTDDDRFAVIWAARHTLEAAFDLGGAFNEAVVRLSRGASEDDVIAAIDTLLAPYGGRGAYGRDDQVSHRFLSEELRQLDTMTFVMTPIFLGVTVFLLNVVIGRMVQTERDQIGLMKAFGYSDGEIGAHYAKFALVLALGGAVVGWLGGLYLGGLITEIYRQYYHFPFLIFVTDFRTALYAVGFSLLGAGVGAWGAVRRAVALEPALAMRPPTPERYGQLFGLQIVVELLDRPTRMIFRQMLRRPVRSATLTLGISAAMALSVMMEFNSASVRHILGTSFDIVDRSDITVMFREPLDERAALDLRKLPGVERVEGFRSVSVSFVRGRKEHLGAITGVVPMPALNRIVDRDGGSVEVPAQGLLLSRQLANMLGVAPGDRIEVRVREGRQPVLEVVISGLIDAMLGTPAYMAIDDLNRRLLEPGRLSGAYLTVAPEAMADLKRRMKEIPQLASVTVRSDVERNFEELLESGPGTFRVIMTLFAALIAVGVVYNGARITFSERRHDIASLRVLGFTQGEVAYVIVGELMLLAVLALPIGSVLGTLLWSYICAALSTELYQVPMVSNPAGYGVAGFTVLAATAVSALMIRRDLLRLDMVAALKAQD